MSDPNRIWPEYYSIDSAIRLAALVTVVSTGIVASVSAQGGECDRAGITVPAGFERFSIDPQRFGVLGKPDTIANGFPEGGHNSKSIVFGEGNDMFVSVGSVSNACRANRNETAPDPCPEMGIRSGIWRYDATRLHQRHPQDGERWATGVRNGMGLYWHGALKALFGTSHGRDGLRRSGHSSTPTKRTPIPHPRSSSGWIVVWILVGPIASTIGERT